MDSYHLAQKLFSYLIGLLLIAIIIDVGIILGIVTATNSLMEGQEVVSENQIELSLHHKPILEEYNQGFI